MGYIITLIVCFLGALVAMAAVGCLLPRSHVATAADTYPVPPERLYELAVKLQSESDVKSRVTEEQPPRQRITQVIEEPGAAFGGTWTLLLESEAEGTRLTIKEQGHVYNPLFRFLARFVFGHHATMRHFLQTLHQRVKG